jgi:hypothetical protein
MRSIAVTQVSRSQWHGAAECLVRRLKPGAHVESASMKKLHDKWADPLRDLGPQRQLDPVDCLRGATWLKRGLNGSEG